jgi:hypothetical protein
MYLFYTYTIIYGCIKSYIYIIIIIFFILTQSPKPFYTHNRGLNLILYPEREASQNPFC